MTNKSENSPKKFSRLRVLIADDVQETRRGTRLMLAMIPHLEVVAIARNGRQAVEMARENKPDIAIMDINMPEMDGLSAIEAMQKTYPDMVCIVISAEKDSQTLQDAMASGAREYLIKPFTSEELEQALKRASRLVLASKQRIDRTIQLHKQRRIYLSRLALEYSKSRKTDDKAMEVFEQLAAYPDCDIRWLMTLGMIYIIRRKWDRLKKLAARLEQKSSQV